MSCIRRVFVGVLIAVLAKSQDADEQIRVKVRTALSGKEFALKAWELVNECPDAKIDDCIVTWLIVANELKGKGVEAGNQEAIKILEWAKGLINNNMMARGAILSNLAMLYKANHDYIKAELLYVEVVNIQRSTLGPSHPDVGVSLSVLASIYEAQDKLDSAEPLRIEALGIRRKESGPKHISVVPSLSSLGILYLNKGDYAKSEQLLTEALEIRRTAFGANHPEIAANLSNLAGLYEAQARYAEALPLLVEAVASRRTFLGVNYPGLGTYLNNLASVYRSLGKYREALQAFTEAFEINKSALDANHPNIAGNLDNLAGVYQDQGSYDKAEQHYLEALQIRKKALGAKHSDTAISLNNIAGLYLKQGKIQSAIPFLAESLDITKENLGVKHPSAGTSVSNLASLYLSQGNYDKAESLHLEALEIFKTSLGAKHPSTAISLNNLASLYAHQGKYEKAEPLHIEALEIIKNALGDKHLSTGRTLSHLAKLYYLQGRYSKAHQLFLETYLILCNTLGANHSETASGMNNLGNSYAVQDENDGATAYYLEAVESLKAFFESNLTSMNESERRAFLDQFEGSRHVYFSHTFLRDLGHGKSALAVKTAFLNKGIRLHAARETQTYLESAVGSAAQTKQSRMVELDHRISLLRARLSGKPSEEREALRQGAEELIQSMENEVASLRAEYLQDAATRKLQGRVDVAGLQANLKSSEAFLEIDAYQEFLLKAKGLEKKFGDRRYGAIVFRKTGEPVLVNLGKGERIDKLVRGLREMGGVDEEKDTIWVRTNRRLALKSSAELNAHRLRYQTKLKELWKLVLEPVEAKLGTAEFAAVKSWVICPDGPLHGLAWETLMDGQGRYLRQRAQVRYVESPRAFIYKNEERATGKPLYVHTPDYGNGKAPSVSAGPGMWSAGLAPMQRGVELGRAIQGLHADVEILTGTAASEEKLRKLENRREVVIYTHGEYVEGPMSTNEEMGRVRIALAGAAKGMGKREEIDGTLTASDVAAWRLRGADLVALVGCETGVGSGDVGEGLQGMRRALYLAGSKWQLLSLWTVVDAAAEIWMEQFYEKRKLNPKLGLPEVVDLVQKNFLSGKVKPKRADGTDLGMDHPLLWAGMTLNGQ